MEKCLIDGIQNGFSRMQSIINIESSRFRNVGNQIIESSSIGLELKRFSQWFSSSCSARIFSIKNLE